MDSVIRLLMLSNQGFLKQNKKNQRMEMIGGIRKVYFIETDTSRIDVFFQLPLFSYGFSLLDLLNVEV